MEETEATVQSLLDKIRREGVENAEKEAEKIVENARSKASGIVEDAEAEAERKLEEARREAEKTRTAAETSISQAARDLILAVREQISRLCDRILEREVADTLSPETMKELVVKLTEAWNEGKGEADLEILLSEADREKLEDMLWEALQEELRTGVTLRPVEGIDAGFRIGERQGSMHYDFTAKGIAAVLGEYLNPRISRYLEEAARGDESEQG